MVLSKENLLRLVILAAFTYASTFSFAQSTVEARKQQQAFVDIVNQHAIVNGMIVSSKTLTDDCRLELKSDFAEHPNPALARIYQEVQRSPIANEIARFNRPRKPADTETFVVDPGDCALSQYVGASSYFHPPITQSKHPFVLRYGGEKVVNRESLVLMRPGEKRVRIRPGNATRSDIYLNKTQISQTALGSDVVLLWWGDELLAEWYRNGWSVIKRGRASNFILTLHGPQGVADLTKELASATTVAFPGGMVLSIQEKTKKNGVRQRASLFLETSDATRPLYEQTSGGKRIWSRSPTNFEAQIVRSLRAAGTGVSPVVTLSIDTAISATLQSITDDAGTALKRELGKNSRNRPTYASIAMLDGNTGAIVGVSAYPPSSAPQRFDSGEVEPLLETEEFLKRRVIGSVAKVPVGFSVLAASPRLQTLRLYPYDGGAFDTVLGEEIHALHDHSARSCGTMVDFKCFISKSLNRYGATLLATAAVVSDGKSEGFDGGSRPLGKDSFTLGEGSEVRVSHQPPGFLFKSTPTGDDLTKLPWANMVTTLFDAKTRLSPTDSVRENYHLYMWRHAVRPNQSLLAFGDVSPEVENLQLNQAGPDFRNGYLLTILGGRESRWSAVKVAESFARAVSLKRIEATFVESRASVKMPSDLIGELTRDQKTAHRTLLDGLTDVVDNGTAKSWLSERKRTLVQIGARAGQQVRVYAKTGTPVVDSSIASNMRTNVRDLIRKRVISWRQKGAAGGREFLYRGTAIADKPVVDPLDRDERGLEEMLLFFALFNKQTEINQARYCAISGVDVDCQGASRVTTDPMHDDGRNLAIVVEVWRDSVADARPCRSVSLAFSNSLKKGSKDDSVFRKMVISTLADRGPVTTFLGLGKNDTPCTFQN